MVVCGVVEPLALEPEVGDEAEELSPPRPRRPQGPRPQHRAKHKPQRNYRRPVDRDSSVFQDFGNSRVIYDADYVVPLFIAHLEDDNEALSCNMSRGGLQRTGKAQVGIRKSGERVWLPPRPVGFDDPMYKFSYKKNHYRNQKRRTVAKDRERNRRCAREAKASAAVSMA